jgi:hypothetical protein
MPSSTAARPHQLNRDASRQHCHLAPPPSRVTAHPHRLSCDVSHRHCHQALPLDRHCCPAFPCSPPTGLHVDAPACAPPLPRASTTTGRPCRLGIAAGRHVIILAPKCHVVSSSSLEQRPSSPLSYRPARVSERGVHCPHRPHTVDVILKAGEEDAALTSPSSIKVREICTYIFTTRWIVDCGGVYLA